MATVARRLVPIQPDVRMIFPGVGWAGLEHAKGLLGGRSVRITYVHGDLSLMSPGFTHEAYLDAFRDLVKMVSRAFRIPCRSLGSPLLERREVDTAKMPDASFYLRNAARVAGRLPAEEGDPVPDLVIEVEVTHPVERALQAYAQLGVAEVWHFARRPRRPATLRFLRLEGGAWTQVATSSALPMVEAAPLLPIVERVAILDEHERDELIEAWIRDELRPGRRRRPRRGG